MALFGGTPFSGSFGNALPFGDATAGTFDTILGTGLAWERSQEAAATARAWMKMMSDTAHQREVRDLRAASRS